MAQNQCSAYDSQTEWLEAPRKNYSICYTAEYAHDVPFVEKWIDHAEALLIDKYGADLRDAKGRTRLHVNVMLLPYSNEQANVGRTGFYCCQDSSGASTYGTWLSGVYSQIPYLTPSHHEWKREPRWGVMQLPPDDFHAKNLVHEFFHAGQRVMWGSVSPVPVAYWVHEGLPEYEGMFHSTEYNRTDGFRSLVRYVHDQIPDRLYCCQALEGTTPRWESSTTPTFGSTSFYFGGSLILKYLADAFGEDIHVRLMRHQYPSFEEALVAEIEAAGTTVSETFEDLQRWLQQKYRDL